MNTLEFFEQMNNDQSLIKTHGLITSINNILKFAYHSTYKMALPEDVEYKSSTFNYDNALTNIRTESSKFDIFCNENISEARRILLFQNILERVPAADAVFLTHVKNQTLDKLYPNLTYDIIADSEVVENMVRRKTIFLDIPTPVHEIAIDYVVAPIVQDEIVEQPVKPKGGLVDNVNVGGDTLSIVFDSPTVEPINEEQPVKTKRTRKKKTL